MTLLNVDNLGIRYDDNVVVDDVSFEINRGESVGLVGRSGSGKSQTAMAMLGLLPRSATMTGRMQLDGATINAADEKALNAIRGQRIGMVFQDPMLALNPYLKIGRQLREILLSHKVDSGKAATDRVVAMLGRVGLPDPEQQLDAYPHQLSGGMRQRAMIASALICEPDLLIADEPTTALDVTVQAQILDLLETLRDDTALLLITHDLGIVAGRCERLLVLDEGRLVEAGATTSVFAAPRSEQAKQLLADAPRIDRGEVPVAKQAKTVLSIEKASVRYRDRGQELVAVREASLSLREAETLALVGESGSGKSSLVRAVLGLIPMHSGRVVYAGERLGGAVQTRAAKQRRDLQLVFQDPSSALNPQMRVRDIVAEPLLVNEPSGTRDARHQKLQAILKKVGLDESYLNRFPHQLSGGQAQRVAIARALILEPKILICDEAVAALDGAARRKVLALLKTVQEESGLSIIFISHDLSVVRSVCHRIAVMYLGRLVEVATTEALFSAPRHPYSRALIDASPVPDPRATLGSAPLQGEIPSLRSPPSGCVFHPRCKYSEQPCSESRPELKDEDGTRVACHRAAEIDLKLAY